MVVKRIFFWFFRSFFLFFFVLLVCFFFKEFVAWLMSTCRLEIKIIVPLHRSFIDYNLEDMWKIGAYFQPQTLLRYQWNIRTLTFSSEEAAVTIASSEDLKCLATSTSLADPSKDEKWIPAKESWIFCHLTFELMEGRLLWGLYPFSKPFWTQRLFPKNPNVVSLYFSENLRPGSE